MPNLFPDKPIFAPLRLLSAKFVRNWVIRRLPPAQPFSWIQRLDSFERTLVVLPTDLLDFADFLPLLLKITEQKKSVLFIAALEFESLTKMLGLHTYCHFFDPVQLRFFNPTSHDLALKIHNYNADALLYLDSHDNLVLLNCVAQSRIALRLGQYHSEHEPFLNTQIRCSSTDRFLNILQDLYGFANLDVLHPLLHRSAKLSSSQVLLLNLEESNSQQAWSEAELVQITQILDPQFRLLAIHPQIKRLQELQPLLDRLAIRTAPAAGSYAIFLEMLQQYRGMITLHSPHAELALRIAQIPMVMFVGPEGSPSLPPQAPVHLQDKSAPWPKDIFHSLLK